MRRRSCWPGRKCFPPTRSRSGSVCRVRPSSRSGGGETCSGSRARSVAYASLRGRWGRLAGRSRLCGNCMMCLASPGQFSASCASSTQSLACKLAGRSLPTVAAQRRLSTSHAISVPSARQARDKSAGAAPSAAECLKTSSSGRHDPGGRALSAVRAFHPQRRPWRRAWQIPLLRSHAGSREDAAMDADVFRRELHPPPAGDTAARPGQCSTARSVPRRRGGTGTLGSAVIEVIRPMRVVDLRGLPLLARAYRPMSWAPQTSAWHVPGPQHSTDTRPISRASPFLHASGPVTT